MADEEKALPLRIISSKVIKGQGIRAVLEMIMRDHQHFDAFLAVAVVPTDDPDSNEAVVYTTNLNHLEKLGLLVKAKDTIQNDS
jgi:hypothetical protein